MLLLVTAVVVIAWLAYNIFFRIQEAFEGNTVSVPYFFNIADVTSKGNKGNYTIPSFPPNATKINNIYLYACKKSGGDDNDPKTYTYINGPTIDAGSSTVQFRSPSYNERGQSIGTLNIISKPQPPTAKVNEDNTIFLPCNINQNGDIVGTRTHPGSKLQITNIGNDKFNGPKLSKQRNNVKVVITYAVS
jgi:hypothetical protein